MEHNEGIHEGANTTTTSFPAILEGLLAEASRETCAAVTATHRILARNASLGQAMLQRMEQTIRPLREDIVRSCGQDDCEAMLAVAWLSFAEGVDGGR